MAHTDAPDTNDKTVTAASASHDQRQGHNPHGIINLNETEEVAHGFAQMQTTLADQRQLEHMLHNLRAHLHDYMGLENRPDSVTFINERERTGRYIFYDVAKLKAAKELFIVVFYGSKRTDLAEVTDDLFKTDWAIATSMLGTDKMLCYASQEMDDGNWFNVVLFSQEPDKNHVRADPKHHYAAYELAPKRFDWVRLHNAWLYTPLLGDIHDVRMQSTKYYRFADHWFAKRTYDQGYAPTLQ